MIDSIAIPHPLHGEKLLSFAVLARALPSRSGGHACPSTLWRWSTVGARNTTGERLRLERVRVGGCWFSSAEAVGRFLAALLVASIDW